MLLWPTTEEARIGATLDSILAFAAQNGWNAEVIVVNDGSSDQTAELVRQQAIRNPILLRLVNNPGNRVQGIQRSEWDASRTRRNITVQRRGSLVAN